MPKIHAGEIEIENLMSNKKFYYWSLHYSVVFNLTTVYSAVKEQKDGVTDPVLLFSIKRIACELEHY